MYDEILKNQAANRDAALGAALDKNTGTRILEYQSANYQGEFSSDEDMQSVFEKKSMFDGRDEAAADELENAAYSTEAAKDYPETDFAPYHSTADYTMIFDPEKDADVTGASQT